MVYLWKEQYGITRASLNALSAVVRHPGFLAADFPHNETALKRWETRAWPQTATLFTNAQGSAHVNLRDIIREYLSDEVSSSVRCAHGTVYMIPRT